MKAGEKPGLPRFKPHSWFRPIELYAGADRFLQVNAGGTKATIRIKGLPAMRLRLHRPVARGSAPGHPHHQDTAAGGGVPGVCARGPSTGGSGDGAPVGIDAGVAKRITLSERPPRRPTRAGQAQAPSPTAPCGTSKARIPGRRKKVAALAREWQRIAEHNRGDEHQVAAAIDETG